MNSKRSLATLTLLVALLLILMAAGQDGSTLSLAVPLSGEEVRGELFGWGPGVNMSAGLGGTFIYTGQETEPDDAVAEFKFYKSDSGGLWYGKDSPNTVSFGVIFSGVSTGGGGERNLRFNHIANKYYAFKWNANDKGVVFQFSGAPATITGVSRAPAGSVTNADTVTVTAATNATPPTEQTIWLRYTTNAWSSSTVVKMTGSGASYAAQIPAQPDGTTVAYYVFSSGDVSSISGSDADLMTVSYNNSGGSNYSYNIGNPIADAQALWVGGRVIAWNGAAGSSYKLLYDPDGAIDAATAAATPCPDNPAGLTAPCFVTLTIDGAIGTNQFPKNPNANGKTRLDLPESASLGDATLKALLKGQVVVVSYDGGGGLVDLSRTQVQGVLDDLYVDNSGTAGDAVLGVTYSGDTPTVRLWAPTAKSVKLRRYADSGTPTYTEQALVEDTGSGVWSVTGDSSWDRQFYLFDVEVYVPGVDAVVNNLVTDPYAITLSTDTTDTADPRSQFVNLADADLKPPVWDGLTKPGLAAPEDIVIYEMHVRDFSINDNTVASGDRGTYMAFTYDGAGPDPNTTLSDGMKHVLALKDAGLTHVHLLPAFDIASVPENSVPRTVSPNPTGFARDAQDQQAAVSAAHAGDGFNWGYDPYHYGAPEGSYSTNPDGVQRILEFRRMVSALNQNGLRVVMDVVYNHTAAKDQEDKSVLDKITPGYYHRYDTNGVLYQKSCCADTASEYAMFEKLMIDTLKRWASDYKVDSFRFDLMNFHTRQNMLDVKAALQAIDPNIYLYGEGWDFGSAAEKGLTTCPNCYAKQTNMTGQGIGLFNDRIRDASHGGFSPDPLQIRHQGFINGLHYDWNGYGYTHQAGSGYEDDLHYQMGRLRTALAGSVADFTDDPQETINYVEKHDNETLFDQNVFKLPSGTTMADRVRSQNLGTSIVGLAQGIPFLQMGQDILRSKSLDRNSYDSGDWFNRVDWSYGDGSYDNNFGKGLPLAADNGARWSIMSPLLANTGLDPAATDAQTAAAHMREILRIRKSSPLFRLTSEADINARIGFYNTDDSKDGLIVMALSDAVGVDLDPNYETLIVFFNANKLAETFTIAALAGNAVTLHPQHTNGVDDDPVLAGAGFDSTTGTFYIPARSTVVFVSPQGPNPAAGTSGIGWVGNMDPPGSDYAGQLTEGSSQAVSVEVFKPPVTEAPGQGAGVQCFLHWGTPGKTWTNTPMAYSSDVGNNDKYQVTIPAASLPPGNYGFTTYCTDDNGVTKKWRDGSDLLRTVIPTADASPTPTGGVFVHLFEWKWTDIAKECTFLAQKGYKALQVSPPMEHVIPVADMGDANADYPWWVRYQPVSYSLAQSRSGSLAEFQSMVNTCNSLGVAVYVDAVINHMAGPQSDTATGTGTNNSSFQHYDYPAYDLSDFHYCGTNASANDSSRHNIVSYASRFQVQNCELENLADLDTGRTAVQNNIRAYLQGLLNLGVKGFRIDASKHMAAGELQTILEGLTLPGGGAPYIFQEVIDQGGEPVQAFEYTPNGDVTEFKYSVAIGNVFKCGHDTLSSLQTLGTGFLDSSRAVAFTDNHDNQRGHGAGGPCIVSFLDGQEYNLANIFMLAHPYGYPDVMSSYYWDGTHNNYGPPSTTGGGAGSGPDTINVYGPGQVAGDTPLRCGDGTNWVCEHRRTAIANMVGFRLATAGEAMTNWQTFAGNDIAFGRGAKGFVAINRTASAVNHTYQTGLPAGDYCDIIHYDFTGGRCLQPGTTTPAPASSYITVNGSGQVVNRTVAAMDAFAIYVEARIFTTLPPVISGGGVQHSWPDHPAAASCRVLRKANVPYFDPSSYDTLFPSAISPFTDYTAGLNSSAVNHFYVTQALNASGAVIGTSGWSGEFTFDLVPGD